MRLFNFRKMTARKKAVLGTTLGILLVGLITLGWAAKTGRIQIGADTTGSLIQVNLSGKVLDSDTQQPIAQADIQFFDENGTRTTTKTGSLGNYTLTASVNRMSDGEVIFLQVQKEGYPFITDSSSIWTSLLPPDVSSPFSLRKDFGLYKPLFSPPPIGIMTLSTCATGPNFTGRIVNGIVFCYKESDEGFIDQNLSKIQVIASEINRLRSLTGYSDIPRYVWIGKLNSVAAAEAVWEKWGINLHNEHLSDDTLSDILPTINHEFGHLVDFKNSWKEPSSSSARNFCWQTSTDWVTCPASSSKSFIAAYEVALKNKVLSRYATTNNLEMFAEFFAGLVTKGYPAGSGEKFRYVIENKLLFNTYYNFHLSSISPFGSPSSQNSLMFVYKFVAKLSSQNEYFPGSIGTGPPYDAYDYQAIDQGKYMTAGVVSIILRDHTRKMMENTNVSVGGTTLTTRLKKTSGVFSDGSGDLFDTTGTNVILNAPIDSQLVNVSPPDYYQGAVWLGQKVNIIQGSNPVTDLSFWLHQDKPVLNGRSDIAGFGAEGKVISKTNGRQVAPIVKGQMTRYPDLGTLGGVVDTTNATKTHLDFVLGGDPSRDEKFYLAGVGRVNNLNIPKISHTTPGVWFQSGKTCTYDYSKISAFQGCVLGY